MCLKIGSGATPRGGKEVYVDAGTALIRSQNVYNDGFHFDGLTYISDEHAKQLAGVTVAPGDVLLNITGDSVARACMAHVDVLPARVNQHVAIIRTDPERLDGRYLRYYLISPSMQQHMLSLASAGATRNALTKGMIEDFQIPWRSITEQRAIARILGALDDKIELNRRMNATLEAIARALFTSWFVDFDPVRAKAEVRQPACMDAETAALFPDGFEDSPLGEIPRGWRIGSLLEQAELLSGGTPSTSRAEYWGGDILWASAKDVSQSGECFLIATERTVTPLGVAESATRIIDSASTVVVARGATTGRHVMLGSAMAMNQTCYALRSRIQSPYTLFCQFGHLVDDFTRSAHGSVFDTVTTRTFETHATILPDTRVAAAFDRSVTPLFERILANQRESATLAATRDALLPKLLSGEMRVAGAEQALDAAAIR
jgi:type I restriction enzyme S subunit